MKITAVLKKTWLGAALLAFGLACQAQTTATWIGPASGGEWNTDVNWDSGAPPLDVTTNAFIGRTTNVNYNLPMVATGFGALTNFGILNINTNGFNCDSIIVSNSAARLFVNDFGVVNVTGNVGLFSSAAVSMTAGSSLTVGGTLSFGGNVVAAAFGNFTNYGGTLNAAGVTMNPNNQSVGTSSRLVILGGLNNLGALSINRAPGGNGATPAYGSDGLTISNGFVNTTSISLGNNAHGLMFLVGGTFTNNGTFTIRNGTVTRPARFVQTGGLFVNSEPNLVTMFPSGANGDTVYSVLGGTNIVGGFQFGNGVNAGTQRFTNAATIYVGSGGIGHDGIVTVNAMLNTGGKFGATADWTNAAPLTLNGGSFDAQDASGTPRNIYSSGVLGGSGALIKTGAGTLTLGAANTYANSTIIRNGTLALDAGGSLVSTPIIVGSGTTFDVSAVSGGYIVNSLKVLSGSGVVTGAVTVAAGGIINPGSNTLTGTLTFADSVTEPDGAVNRFDLSANPNGPDNDFISIVGDLNVNGTNIIDISGTLASGAAYGLIQYGGSFNGGLTNFALSSPVGILSNNVTTKTIYVVISTSLRGPTNVTWVGNSVVNDWDTQTTTNWLNNGALDVFLANDNARFDNVGAANPLVNVVGNVSPASIIVDSTANYTFDGSGVIGGTGGLTKTNSGTLSILITNNLYSGITTIAGGVLEVTNVANGNAPSPLGSASPDPLNLVLNGGTFRYSGDSAGTDRGMTLGAVGGIVDVTNPATALTVSGSLSGIGGLTKSGEGNLTLSAANSYGGATTISNGILQISTTASALTNSVVFHGGTLSLNVGGQPTYSNPLIVSNSGTMISAGGNNNIIQAPWSGSGTLTLSLASGTFSINAAMTPNFTGTILLTDASAGTFRFNTGGNGSGAQQSSGSATASFDLGNSTAILLNRNGGAAAFGIYDLGALSGGPTTFVRGAANGGGVINASFYSVGAKNLNTTFAGTIANGTGGAGATTSIIKVGTGIWTLTGQNTYTGSTTVSNGVLALGDGVTDGAIGSSSVINVVAGAFLDVSKQLTPTLNLNSGQTLEGTGTLRGSLDTSAGGTVAPGNPTGIFTVTNNVNLAGTALLRINRSASPNAGKLSAPAITLGGTLVVSNTGSGLQVGDTFDLFDGTLTGTFAGNVTLPGYYTWNTSNLEINGTIMVTGVLPGPTFSSIDGSNIGGGVITLNASGGLPNGSYTVLTTTNLASPVINWTPVANGTFDGNGDLIGLSIPVDPVAPQQFYLLQVQ